MEGNLVFLFAAVTTTWIVIFLYLLFLNGRLTSLRRELDALRDPDRDPDRQED